MSWPCTGAAGCCKQTCLARPLASSHRLSDKGLTDLSSTGSHREGGNQPALCTAWSPRWLSVATSTGRINLVSMRIAGHHRTV